MAYLNSDVDQNGDAKWFWKGKFQPSARQKRVMLARAMEIAVEFLMTNHLYTFDGKVYRQQSGGPIGLDLTGVLARMVMIWWDGQFIEKLKELDIKLEMHKRYIDDQNQAVEGCQPGLRYVDGRLEIQQNKVEEDHQVGTEKSTAKLMRTIGDSITPMIKLEEDVPSNHEDNRLPILDLIVWVEDNRAKHVFYKKPMASRKVISSRSAAPTSEKRTILVQECLRRMKNCSIDQPWNTKAKYINQLMLEMKHAGHSEHFRKTVVIKAINKYKAKLEDHVQGTKRMYRNREEIKRDRTLKGGKAKKDDWFRTAGYTSTLVVLPTPGSQLARQTAEAMSKCPPPDGTKTKIVEMGGSAVQHQLVAADPFPREDCGRRECGLCQHEGCRGLCYKPSVAYSYTCTRCEVCRQQEIEDGNPVEATTVYKYIGESSRTPYTRHTQHLKKYRAAHRNKDNERGQPTKGDEEEEAGGSFMWPHARDHHGGCLGPDEGASDYKLKVEGFFRDTLARQVDEDVRMRQSGWGDDQMARRLTNSTTPAPQCELMNGRGEYFQPKTVRTIFKQF